MSRHHIMRVDVKYLEQLRAAAADVVKRAFDGNQKCVEAIPGFYREAVSRSCSPLNHGTPLFMLAGWLVALCRAGRTDRAQQLVDFLQDVVDRVREPAPSVRAASIAEQRSDGHETNYQAEYGDAPPAERRRIRPLWIAALRQDRASVTQLIRALEDEEAADAQSVTHPQRAVAA